MSSELGSPSGSETDIPHARDVAGVATDLGSDRSATSGAVKSRALERNPG